MSLEITCPSCESTLRFTDRRRARYLTCPRCLEQIENKPDIAPPSDDPGSCPGCAATVEPGWKVCPYCSTGLKRQTGARPDVGLPDQDVQKDTAGTGIGLVLLGAMALLGLSMYVYVTELDLVRESSEAQSILTVALVIFLGVLALCTLLTFRKGSTSKATAGAMAGLSTGAMGCFFLLVMGVVVVSAIFAGIISFFKACTGGAGT